MHHYSVFLTCILLLTPIRLSRADDSSVKLPLVGYNEHRTNLPGGRHANVSTNRAMVVKADGTERRRLAGELVNEAGRLDAVRGLVSGWQDGRCAAGLGES